MTSSAPAIACKRAFVELIFTAALAYTSYAMCRSPLLPLFARHLGASPEMVGLVVAASTITGIAVKMPAGALSDVFGRRALLIGGAAVCALAPFAYAGVATLGWLIALRVAHGNATAIFGPVASATVSDLAPTGRRGQWLGTYSAVQAAAQAAGALVAGSLIVNGQFGRAFIASGVIGVGALALAWRQPRRANLVVNEPWWQRTRAGLGEILSDRRIVIVSGLHAALLLVNGSLSAFLPLFAIDRLGLSTAEIGWLFAGQTAITLMARPVFGAASDRWGRRLVIVLGLTTCAGAFVLVANASDFATLAIAVVLYAGALALATSATSALVTDLSRRARYGAAHGVFGTIYDIGDAAGPIVAGLLVAALGYRDMFLLNATWTLILALGFLALPFVVPVAFQHDS